MILQMERRRQECTGEEVKRTWDLWRCCMSHSPIPKLTEVPEFLGIKGQLFSFAGDSVGKCYVIVWFWSRGKWKLGKQKSSIPPTTTNRSTWAAPVLLFLQVTFHGDSVQSYMKSSQGQDEEGFLERKCDILFSPFS
jgi:hypothetical protein